MPDKAAEYVAKDKCAKDPGLLKMIRDIDRPGNTFARGSYAGADAFAEDDLNPKAGAYAAAGVGYARAEWNVLSAEAKGPNASAGAGVSMACGARAFAKAELASASASAGPLKASVGLAADTGIAIRPTQIEAQFLGTGFSIGSRMGFYALGSGVEIDLW